MSEGERKLIIDQPDFRCYEPYSVTEEDGEVVWLQECEELVEGRWEPFISYPRGFPKGIEARIEETTAEIRKLSNRLETALAEGDNPVSAKCSLVLDETPKCYDFSGTRRFAACRAWQLMELERITWRDAISRAWDEVKEKCTWS